MTFVSQKAVKGEALIVFLAAYPVPKMSKLHEDIPVEVIEANMTSGDDVWQMLFDGTSRICPTVKIIAGVGEVFVLPENRVFLLTESCSNNVAEYNAVLIGFQLALSTMLCSLAFSSLNKWGYGTLKLMVTPN